MPLGEGKLYFASRPRQILENLSPERGTRGKSAGAKAIEELLIRILHANGEVGLNRIRDDARALVEPLGFKDQFKKLDKLIGALLATQADGILKTKEGRLVAKGTPVDPERMARFEVLATELRAIVLRPSPCGCGERARALPLRVPRGLLLELRGRHRVRDRGGARYRA